MIKPSKYFERTAFPYLSVFSPCIQATGQNIFQQSDLRNLLSDYLFALERQGVPNNQKGYDEEYLVSHRGLIISTFN